MSKQEIDAATQSIEDQVKSSRALAKREAKPVGVQAAALEIRGLYSLFRGDFADAVLKSITGIIANHCVGREVHENDYKEFNSQRTAWLEERTQLLAACKEYREKLDQAYHKAARLECAAMNLATQADQLACDLNPNKGNEA